MPESSPDDPRLGRLSIGGAFPLRDVDALRSFVVIDPHLVADARVDRALDRLWSGTASPDDRRLIEAWAASDARRRSLVDNVPRVVAGSSAATDMQTDMAWQCIATRIDADCVRRIRSAPSMHAAQADASPRRMARLWRSAAVAASIAAAAALGAPRSDAGYSLAAPRGQRISTTLPDGTQMTIAAGSHVRWGVDFGDRTRVVTLDGEAYFDVVHDDRRPFRVLARHGLIEDLGTRFTVRAWKELTGVEVVVQEGRVVVRDTGVAGRSVSRRPLVAGERGVLGADGSLQVTQASPSETAWVSGTLQFDNARLSEAIPALERWYNVTFDLDPALAARRLSARFEAQALGQVLIPLGVSLGASVTQIGDTVVIRAR